MQPSFFDEDEVFSGLSDMIVVYLVGVHISRRPFVPKSPGVSWGMRDTTLGSLSCCLFEAGAEAD